MDRQATRLPYNSLTDNCEALPRLISDLCPLLYRAADALLQSGLAHQLVAHIDQGKKAHAAFGLSGFPGIVVIDRAGRVRLTRQGYNSSEASFRGDLTQLLERL